MCSLCFFSPHVYPCLLDSFTCRGKKGQRWSKSLMRSDVWWHPTSGISHFDVFRNNRPVLMMWSTHFVLGKNSVLKSPWFQLALGIDFATSHSLTPDPYPEHCSFIGLRVQNLVACGFSSTFWMLSTESASVIVVLLSYLSCWSLLSSARSSS